MLFADILVSSRGLQVWDLAGIGRVAVLICFDINYYVTTLTYPNSPQLSTRLEDCL